MRGLEAPPTGKLAWMQSSEGRAVLKEYPKCLGVSNFDVFIMSTLTSFCPRWALCGKRRCIGCIDPVEGPGKSMLCQLCFQTP